MTPAICRCRVSVKNIDQEGDRREEELPDIEGRAGTGRVDARKSRPAPARERARLLSELPDAVNIAEQCLATTPVLRSTGWAASGRSACVIVDALQVEEEAGSSIWRPETVQDCDPLSRRISPRFSGVSPATSRRDVRACFGLVDELAGGSRRYAVLDFDSDGVWVPAKRRRASTLDPASCSAVSSRPGDIAQTRSASASTVQRFISSTFSQWL